MEHIRGSNIIQNNEQMLLQSLNRRIEWSRSFIKSRTPRNSLRIGGEFLFPAVTYSIKTNLRLRQYFKTAWEAKLALS